MGRKIFIVEDNNGVVSLLQEMCTELSAQFVHFKGGSEAIAYLEKCADGTETLPDIAVIDLALAESDGFQVAQSLRLLPGGQTVPTVVISGVYKKLPEAFEESVHPMFMPKPFAPSELLAAMRDVLDTRDRASGIQRGRFSKALPDELFVKLAETKASGLLTVPPEGSPRRMLWWQNGFIRFGQSNVRAETAGAVQVKEGTLPAESFERALTHAKLTGHALHEALAATEAFPPDKLKEVLKRQTRDVAVAMLGMAGAEWNFVSTDPGKTPDARMHAVAVLLHRARELMTPEDALEALERLGELQLTKGALLERDAAAVRAAWPGEKVLESLASPESLTNLLQKTRDQDLPLLWALVTSRLVVSQAAPKAAPRAVASNTVTDADRKARDEILRERDRAADQDDYQFLGVARNASTDQIKQAFLGLARKFHSDTYSGLNLGEAADTLAHLFQRLNNANATLTDEGKRAEYDVFIQRKEAGLPTDVAAVLRAEELFNRAAILMKASAGPKTAQALELLEEAIKLNNADPEFHVYHAYAVFRSGVADAGSAAAAKRVIEDALKSAPKLASGRTFLGMIARDMGDLNDAVRQFEKALELDKSDEFATRELRAVRRRLEKGETGSSGPKSIAPKSIAGEGSILQRLFKK